MSFWGFETSHASRIRRPRTEMLSTRHVSDATYKRALDTFGMQTLVDLIAIVGYYCMVSITLNAFEAPLPPGEASPFPD